MEHLVEILEAVIFTAGKGISKKEINEKMPGVTPDELNAALRELKKKYSGVSGVRFVTYNDKVQFSSNPEYGDIVTDILTPIKEKELSKTLLEVLSIIAYKQPVTRLDIEEIRGVSSEYAVTMLQKINMIESVGTKDAVGRPTLFGTTEEFLRKFSLGTINDLPHFEEIMERIKVIDENYNISSESLYRERSEEEILLDAVAASIDGDLSDEMRLSESPDFLEGEEISVLE
ncbi:MAG: SMC-Scp complex subunit ScpB [Clostridiales bacterium]|jgi:segregation and condensation protein B|nr:SMC-Scp complex subunit ScpB [Clostridiales bacterium]